jgi:hypothetical protein
MYTTIALQYSVVLLGIAWGWAARTYPRQVPTLWAVPAWLSLIMLGIASFKSKGTQSMQADRKASWLLIALIAYDAIVMTLDPFFMARDEVSCLLAVALIVLPLLCLKALVRRRAWLAIGGVVLFQATAVASLFYNFPAMRGGVGYFVIWVGIA